ncbi:excinuclease ABC subunit UvrC [Halanaerobium praevalens]|uniref:UvrABC system protein C n=1 Tax=Halanaerobium praevalens (strain ATCC 33744 / DSM 2228 / GSL) TaxID=572479 RepID=E3DR29_HALPG|nr:excinuclease ABC subunit UvrC [Halanaerobium praevalens]ADO78018.1 Excinuclease ABC subunit C [Halanaerobium praevalens DSM 2228]
MRKQQIEAQLKELPRQPGVYLMKDETGMIIYVGKAKSLRNRVRSYFRKNNQTYKTQMLVKYIADFDYIMTDTEVEAYILEANLIKKHQPKFNIRLKDDKSYPYIKITKNVDFPRVFKTRIVKNDGAEYFGPFADVDAIYKTLDVIKDIFQLRSCKKELKANDPEDRPCLNYHIDKCLGPCIGAVSKEDYHQLIDQVCLFLSGKQSQLKKQVEVQMKEAAAQRNFEKAARFRDALKAFTKLSESQKVMTDKNIDQDVVALVQGTENQACAQLLLIRSGRLLGQEYFILEGTEAELESETMASFLQQYYEQAAGIPDELLLNTKLEEQDLLGQRLAEIKNKKVSIQYPQKGDKKKMLEMAERNAQQNLKKENIRSKYEKQRTSGAVEKLGEILGIEKAPYQIEGFDISNIQGTDSVASMVVFKDGRPSKQDYRRFKIKTVTGPDDFASMKEVVERRYARLLREDKKLPDLILIDGGKGQLNAAYEILEFLGIGNLPIIGLAKREEEIFRPNTSEPITLPHHTPTLQLLQRVRDEAHRFAVSYHRKLRSRRLTHSMLDEIPGVGETRRTALLQHFGSLAKIREAKIWQLKEVKGISGKTARKIYDYLREHMRAY